MRWRAALAVATALGLTLALPSPVVAQPRAAARPSDKIAVVCAPSDRFGKRLVAELEALGFSVVAIDIVEGASSPASLEAAARDAGAVAAMRAVSSQRGVEVWIADRATGKTVLREVLRSEVPEQADGALALRAVDLLRASLLERSYPAPRRASIAPSSSLAEQLDLPAPAPLARDAAPTLRFAVLPTLLASPGGVGPSASLELGVAWMPAEHVGVVAFVGLPLSHARVTRGANSADLTAFFGGSALRLGLTRRSSRLAPTVDLGVAIVSVQSGGTAGEGFVGSDVAGTGAAPFLGVGLALAATRNLRLRADVRVALLTRSVALEFAGERAATWGAPLVMPALGGDFGWF